MKLAKEKEWGAIFFLLGVGEAKFRFCSLRSVAFVWIWDESTSGFYFS